MVIYGQSINQNLAPRRMLSEKINPESMTDHRFAPNFGVTITQVRLQEPAEQWPRVRCASLLLTVRTVRTQGIATRVTPPRCCALLPHRPAEERSLARPWAAVAPSIFASVCTHSLRMVCTSSDAFLHWAMKGRIVKKWNSGKGMYNSRGPFLRHPDRTNFGRSLKGVLHTSIV